VNYFAESGLHYALANDEVVLACLVLSYAFAFASFRFSKRSGHLIQITQSGE
jgi:hypothetical protein